MFNFKDSIKLLLDHEVGIEVTNVKELKSKMSYYLNNQVELAAKNEQAIAMIEKNQGAAKANAKLAAKLVKERHILCVRLSAIGDVIHALPIASALREAYPQAEITWIVQQKAYDLVADNPNLDQVVLLPKESWKQEFKEKKWQTIKKAKRYFADLKAEYDFDLALDVHALFKSALTAYLSGAKKLVGPQDGREGSTLFYDQQIEPPKEEVHQIDRNLQLAKAVGAKIDQVTYDIFIAKEVKEAVDQLLTDLGVNKAKKLIAINPFTTWDAKDWFKDRYAKLADKLISQLDCEVLFTGGPSDQSGVAEIIDTMEQSAYNLAGETSLKEVAELYTRADLFIGGDTGPMHLAVAQGAQSVVLMGPTNPKTHGPYGDQHVVLQPDIECKNCWNRICPLDEHLCMEKISVKEVFEAVEELIE